MSTSLIQTSFSRGEIGPQLYGRIDLAAYQNGLRQLSNFIVTPYGGFVNRAGSYFLAQTLNNEVVRLIRFKFNNADAYALEFTHLAMRVYRNGGLVRPAPVGEAKPHSVQATYIGEAGLGHFGRFNVDHAIYYAFGRDSLNPIAGADPQLRRGNAVNVSAGMAAIELSYDKDWLRPRIGFFYATGDRNPRDRTARGRAE